MKYLEYSASITLLATCLAISSCVSPSSPPQGSPPPAGWQSQAAQSPAAGQREGGGDNLPLTIEMVAPRAGMVIDRCKLDVAIRVEGRIPRNKALYVAVRPTLSPKYYYVQDCPLLDRKTGLYEVRAFCGTDIDDLGVPEDERGMGIGQNHEVMAFIAADDAYLPYRRGSNDPKRARQISLNFEKITPVVLVFRRS